jgi:hypothetical protein
MLAERCMLPYNYLVTFVSGSRSSGAGDPGRGSRHHHCHPLRRGSAVHPPHRRRPHLVWAGSSSCSRPDGPHGVRKAPLWFGHNWHKPRWCPCSCRGRRPHPCCNRRHHAAHGTERGPHRRHRRLALLGGTACSGGARSSRVPGKTAAHQQ